MVEQLPALACPILTSLFQLHMYASPRELYLSPRETTDRNPNPPSYQETPHPGERAACQSRCRPVSVFVSTRPTDSSSKFWDLYMNPTCRTQLKMWGCVLLTCYGMIYFYIYIERILFNYNSSL